jgi:hypothetical protein
VSKTFYLCPWEPHRELAARITKELALYEWDCSFDWTLSITKSNYTDVERYELATRHLAGAMDADVVVLILPAGRDAHVLFGAALALGKGVVAAYEDPLDLSSSNVQDGNFYYDAGVERWSYYGKLHSHLLAALMDRILVNKLQEITGMMTNPIDGEEDGE